MPYIIRPKRVRRAVAILFGATLLACAAPAVASAACPSSPASEALARFGDHALYALLPGSTFESGATGWSLSDAEVNTEAGALGASSLTIDGGGQAISPAFCVSSEYRTFRFFARQASSAGMWPGSLNVSLLWTDVFGRPHDTPVASLQPGSEWTLSPVLQLASALPLWMPGSHLQVRLAFQASGSGSWAIDDVFIDPYSR
ncbi:MAG TPA: hypothetical protein VMF09_15530 [Solirubrobacteraceae bacterium]|nr:hypothetical protein [Solirubrobacteraceae bacterium]